MYPIRIFWINVKENFQNTGLSFTFEILYEMKHKLESFQINIVHVNATSLEKNDHVLESFEFPGKKLGKFKISLTVRFSECDNLINWEQSIETTVILLVISYKDKNLIRIGYYLSNQIIQEKTDSCAIQNKRIVHKILPNKPRLVYFSF